MSDKPVLIDFYCGAGGAAKGYQRAGFYVIGVDNNRQPHYCGDEFILGDALEVGPRLLSAASAAHASPPCQKYTRKSENWGRERKHFIEHPDLIEPTRQMLTASGVPWALENVLGAPMRCDVMLCGTMFGLKIIKHRQFECSFPVPALVPCCNHVGVYNPWHGAGRTAEKLREAQGTPWIPMHGGASRKNGVTGDLNNAIPPAYTEWLGRELIGHIVKASQNA